MKWLHALGAPKRFYELSGYFLPWFAFFALALISTGTILGLWFAPADYQQGDAVRIMYLHVPAALLSLFVYTAIAINAFILLIWKIKIADMFSKIAAPLGLAFTFLALATGSLWGKPMWGTYWIWDARLTSEFILFFLYLGLIVLRNAIPEKESAAKACALLALVGFVDIPIIHFSVDWWNTLHQGASLTLLSKPKIAGPMLYPLLCMMVGFFCFFASLVLSGVRSEILLREKKAIWVKQLKVN